MSLCPKCGLNPRRRPGLPCLPCTNEDNRARRQAKREARLLTEAEAILERPLAHHTDPRVEATRELREASRARAEAERVEREQERRQRRLDSDTAPLTVDDWDTSVGNRPNPGVTHRAAQEKRQEFAAAMGSFAEALRGERPLDKDLGNYIGGLAEQERRFSNRRIARSVSIAAAHAELSRELFTKTVEKYFAGKITPTGYARNPKPVDAKRSAVLLLSDLHFGANMDEVGNPIPYRAIEESRRFEYVVRQLLDYKPHYRNNTEAVVILNGDVIDGYLKHDERAGIPLTEQKAVFWHYLGTALGLVAQQFPTVRVVCSPGNHGRNVARHPGRATEDKWDGIEWDMYYALSRMCSSLPNVTFDLPRAAWVALDLHGSKVFVSHGDTEAKVGHPDLKARDNAAWFDRINATRLYGHEFAGAVFGHFHTMRAQPTMLWNGALIPPNGYARTAGYIGEPCGQLLWEAVEGFPVGDLRMICVGTAQDRDEKLGRLITPFRFTA